MSTPPVALIVLVATLLAPLAVQAADLLPKPAQPTKPRLIPRTLPGVEPLPPAAASIDKPIVRAPVSGGSASTSLASNPGQPSDKARIGIIRRGPGPGVTPATDSPGIASSGTLVVSLSEPRPPLRNGQFRVLPKTESDAPVSVQPIP